MHEYGTARGIYGTGNVRSSEPVLNWQEEWHDEKAIQGEFFAAEQWQRRYWSDYACTVACAKIGRIKQGKHACGFWRAKTETKLELLNAATGYGVTQQELDDVLMQRWCTLQWSTLLVHGWKHEDNTNPPRFFEPLGAGPYKGEKVDYEEEQSLIQEAYKARGWDNRGVPTTETLERLGLSYLDEALVPCRAT
jgi:aldehyde:ferredoxin oxidoreductase